MIVGVLIAIGIIEGPGDPSRTYVEYVSASEYLHAVVKDAEVVRLKSDGNGSFLVDLDVVGDLTAGTIQADNGFTGSFTNGDGATVTVVGGIITGVA